MLMVYSALQVVARYVETYIPKSSNYRAHFCFRFALHRALLNLFSTTKLQNPKMIMPAGCFNLAIANTLYILSPSRLRCGVR